MNRSSVFCLALTLVIGFSVIQTNDVFAAPQDAVAVEEVKSPSRNAAPTKKAAPEQYLVTVAQYSLKGIDPSEFTSAGISAAIKAQNASPVEAVVLSAAAGNESSVSFGREASVNVGKVTSRSGSVTRSTELRSLGTIVRVQLMPEEGKVKGKLSFESTRNVGEGTDDSPPKLVKISIDTSQTFELGRPTLVAVSTEGESTYVLLTITRQ